jgi:ATP-dependent protease ClpP protease subunit
LQVTQDARPDNPDDQNASDTDWQSRFAWFTEAFVLRSVFRSLIVGSFVFLGFDFHQIYQEANAPLPGETERQEPVVMEPPKREDQVRPYLPLSNPLRGPGDAPKMPGYAKPPAQEKVAARMEFARGPKGAASAVGRIEPGTAADLARFLEGQGGEIKTLYLHSPGGSVSDALQMSQLLRDKSIDTVVPDNGYCASSCPIVFSGGTKRTAGGKAWVGVHQIYTAGGAPGDVNDGMSHGQTISAEVQDHLGKMGVVARAWIHAMKTPSEQLYVFTPEELTEYKLATRIGT